MPGLLDIIFATLGTRGDIIPILLVARELRRRGHRVKLLANENWAQLCAAYGVPFAAIADEDDPQDGRDDHDFFLRNMIPSFRKSFEIVAAAVRSGRRPMLIYRANMLGLECAAEKFGLLNGRIFLQPSAIRSCQRPAWPLSRLTEGTAGWLGRNLLVPALYAAGEATSRYRRHTDAFRRSIGVRVRSFVRPARPPEDFSLLMCPSWFALPQSDWPTNLYVVGFPPAESDPPDREARAFIEDRGPPIVFTPGTGRTNARWFFDRAAQVLQQCGSHGIFLGRTIPDRYHDTPEILCRSFINLGWLLPRARALFHHGGIGSAAAALRAGIPQLIMPDRFDQPDNAMRIARLGLGAAILSDRNSLEEWLKLLDQALTSSHVRTQVATAAQLMEREDAIMNSIRIIEHHSMRRETGETIKWPLGVLPPSDRTEETVQIC